VLIANRVRLLRTHTGHDADRACCHRRPRRPLHQSSAFLQRCSNFNQKFQLCPRVTPSTVSRDTPTCRECNSPRLLFNRSERVRGGCCCAQGVVRTAGWPLRSCAMVERRLHGDSPQVIAISIILFRLDRFMKREQCFTNPRTTCKSSCYQHASH
jgi:hypothetical protein